jgi:hypothetical protein
MLNEVLMGKTTSKQATYEEFFKVYFSCLSLPKQIVELSLNMGIKAYTLDFHSVNESCIESNLSK